MDTFKQLSVQLDAASGKFLKNVLSQCTNYRQTLEDLMADDSLSSDDPVARAIRKDYWIASSCVDNIEAAAHHLERFIELEIHDA